jgi:hypothetical protein
MSTRKVGIKSREPAVLAPTAPAMTNPAMVKARIPKVSAEVELTDAPTVRAPINGMSPPMVNATAEAIEA